MKFSQFRITLLTFILGFYSVSALTPLYDKWSEPSVNLPKIESEEQIIIRVCPKPLTEEQAETFYQEHHFYYVPQSEDINCNQGGGGGGWREETVELLPVSKVRYATKASLKSCCRSRK